MYKDLGTILIISMIINNGQEAVVSADNNGYIVTQDDLEVTYQNEEYVKVEVNVTNVGKITYMSNAKIEVLKTLPNNLIVKISLGKMENGKFILQTGVPIKHRICQWIQKDKILYPGFAKHGSLPRRCPIKPGTFFVKNYTLDVDDLPSMPIPPGEYKMIFDIANDNIKMLTVTTIASLLP